MPNPRQLGPVDGHTNLRTTALAVRPMDKEQISMQPEPKGDLPHDVEARDGRSEALFRLLNVFMPMPADLIEFVLDYSCGEVRFKKRNIHP